MYRSLSLVVPNCLSFEKSDKPLKILGEFDAILNYQNRLCQAIIKVVQAYLRIGLISLGTARRLDLFQSDLFEAIGNVD